MGWKNWLGLAACIVLIGSCFMHWTFYPDLQKHFTGFFTEKNYYGRPGLLLSFVAGFGILSYLLNKVWSYRLNLIFSAIGMAYAIKSYLLYTSAYDGYVPTKEAGIFIMLLAALLHMAVAMVSMAAGKRKGQ
jgi:hypothetical protein